MLTWFITGASRGFGVELAGLALERRDNVVATARDPRRVEEALGGPNERLLAVRLDVTKEDEAAAAVEQSLARFGRIDVLVNNAGRGFIGAVEEASAEEVQATFDVNVVGLLAVTRAVLPVMRRQGSGRVLNVGSVGGFVSRGGAGIYTATKFAVEALSEALRQGLEPLGIQVTVVEPGAFRTDFLDSSSLVLAERVIDDYNATAGAFRERAVTFNHGQPGDPHKAAKAMVTIATAEDPPIRVALGRDAAASIEGKLATVASELALWRDLSESTDHD